MDDCLVVCEIARDALQELFGAPSASCDALVATFDAHRERIEEVARAYLERSDCVAGIHLTAAHFQQLEPT